MSRLRKAAFAVGVLLGAGRRRGKRERIVAEGAASPGAELAVVALLLLSALFAVGFIVVLATGSWPNRARSGPCFSPWWRSQAATSWATKLSPGSPARLDARPRPRSPRRTAAGWAPSSRPRPSGPPWSPWAAPSEPTSR